MDAQLICSTNRRSSSVASRFGDDAVDLFDNCAPLGFAGRDTNLYRYVGNDPTNATDPDGLASRELNKGQSDLVSKFLGSESFKKLKEQDAKRAAALQKVIEDFASRLSDKAVEILLDQVKDIKFLPSRRVLRETVKKDTGRDYFGLSGLEGVFDLRSGTLYCNVNLVLDSAATVLRTLIHELGHAIDKIQKDGKTTYSSQKEWNEIWQREIAGDPIARGRIPSAKPDEVDKLWPKAYPLSPHASSNAQAGFAEFFLLVVTDPAEAKKRFPLAYEYFLKQGLININLEQPCC